jgi:hypothetical protein
MQPVRKFLLNKPVLAHVGQALLPETEPAMKASSQAHTANSSASADWRAAMLARIQALIVETDPEMIEEWKWVKPTNPEGVPVYSHAGLVCTLESYKTHVKITFAKGAMLPDPVGLFNSSLEGNVRRAIDWHQGDEINEMALKALIRAAVALNLKGKAKAR